MGRFKNFELVMVHGRMSVPYSSTKMGPAAWCRANWIVALGTEAGSNAVCTRSLAAMSAVSKDCAIHALGFIANAAHATVPALIAKLLPAFFAT